MAEPLTALLQHREHYQVVIDRNLGQHLNAMYQQ
jgi:hypothetical protein